MEGLDPASREDRIAGDRVVLRRAVANDLAMFHAAMSDPGVMRFWSTLPHADLQTSRDWVEAMISADAEISDDFVIEVAGEPAGKLGCWRLPEIGYLLHPDFQGHGYAAEALGLFVGYMRRRGLPHLKADVDPRNLPSLRLLQRAGFVESGRKKGTWLIGGELCDSVYLELTLSPS